MTPRPSRFSCLPPEDRVSSVVLWHHRGQADTATGEGASELKLGTEAPWLRGKARAHVPGADGHGSVHSASGFPPSIQYMMSKTRSREK